MIDLVNVHIKSFHKRLLFLNFLFDQRNVVWHVIFSLEHGWFRSLSQFCYTRVLRLFFSRRFVSNYMQHCNYWQPSIVYKNFMLSHIRAQKPNFHEFAIALPPHPVSYLSFSYEFSSVLSFYMFWWLLGFMCLFLSVLCFMCFVLNDVAAFVVYNEQHCHASES